jgi:hypothetical protein
MKASLQLEPRAGMTELTTTEEFRLTEATSTFFRLIALDRAWTTIGRRPGLGADDIDALSYAVGQMSNLVGRAVDSAYEVVTLAIRAEPPRELQDPSLLSPDVGDVFQTLLNRDGGVPGIAERGYDTLRGTSQHEIAELERQMDVLRAGGHIEADLSRRFMCGLAKSLMAAGGITVWVPPHVHAVASISAGTAIYTTNRCWELEPAR